MIEILVILTLFGIYTCVYLFFTYVASKECRLGGQVITIIVASALTLFVVGAFNVLRGAKQFQVDTYLISDSVGRNLATAGVAFIAVIGIVHLCFINATKHPWSSAIYVAGLMTMTAILMVFPSNNWKIQKETTNVSRRESTTVTEEKVLLETVLYDGQSGTDVIYLWRDVEKPWASVSEPTTVGNVEWSKQWRVKQGNTIVPVSHTPASSPELRADRGDYANDNEFTRWLAYNDEPIRITRVVKQHIIGGSKTSPRDVIVVYYEPINKQVYQQYRDMRALDAKVNPEQHKQGGQP